MAEKTTVTITTCGVTKTLTADSVIIFAADDIRELKEGKKVNVRGNVAFAGVEIPKSYFANLFADLVSKLINELYKKSPLERSFNCYAISEALKRESDKIDKEEIKNLEPADFEKHAGNFFSGLVY